MRVSRVRGGDNDDKDETSQSSGKNARDSNGNAIRGGAMPISLQQLWTRQSNLAFKTLDDEHKVNRSKGRQRLSQMLQWFHCLHCEI
jgi:hypothetical protein